MCALSHSRGPAGCGNSDGVKNDRREPERLRGSGAPSGRKVERRAPTLVVQGRDVAGLVALLTLLDTAIKLVIARGACP